MEILNITEEIIKDKEHYRSNNGETQNMVNIEVINSCRNMTIRANIITFSLAENMSD